MLPLAVSVRPATEHDIPVLVEMSRALHAESPRFSKLTFSPEKVAWLIRSMVVGTLVTAPVGGALVAEKGGTIVGMIGGFIYSPCFSTDKVASDYTFYVRPEHRRKGRAAILLIRALEAWAVEQGAVEIVPGTATLIDAAGTVSFFAKLGYENVGCLLSKRLMP